ncbi:succinate dehydrogenase [Candidatus Chlamydia sanziniae]|uniref:Succinate dehydrogenase cytochrome b558 subunit n=1 Tax=Candidatus Chlamydia sanziniae TaxID=1806891 RepID=A0A1A9HUC9_9CHLA|nr:succinate dehydrogenase [Candidatus Chlamydia sanziniae]ANH78589.1 Succinate dehydrogenase cytochrome b558 subunit [Candidatus Chlamydia sanziniae]
MTRREICSGTTQNKQRRYFAFLLRCTHSLAGLAFTLFLCEHIFTNMLASSYLSYGKGFIAIVDNFHKVPGLKIIEVVCLALPFICHALIGIVYLFQGESNSYPGDGSRPYLPYARNYAYTWQRWTAWILLFGVAIHVVHLRFLRYPMHIDLPQGSYYVVTIDPSRYTAIVKGTDAFLVMNVPEAEMMIPRVDKQEFKKACPDLFLKNGSYLFTPNAGRAFLYVVRDVLGILWVAVFYTVLVLAAAFHGLNGLWTFCSRWGVMISSRKQLYLRTLYYVAMIVVVFMGVSVIWNLYSVA